MSAFRDYATDFEHIKDPYEKRRLALESIDNASFSWYHVRAIVVAGIGFMTDAYDIFAINIATTMFGYVYYGSTIQGNANLPTSTSSLVKVSTSVGTVIGQLLFGWLADVVGRKRIYGVELIIIIASTILQTMAANSSAVSFIAVLVFWRIIMGIGIGGDYPLSSIITAEFANTKWRGAMMSAVFANQGWGQLLGALVAIISVVGFKNSLVHADTVAQCGPACINAIDKMWRLLIGFGAVPAVAALYFRLTIPETPRYTFDVARQLDKGQADIGRYLEGKYGDASAQDLAAKSSPTGIDKDVPSEAVIEFNPPKASLREFCSHFSQWKHFKILLGCAGSWFLLDVAFYGLGLNNSVILATIGYAGQKNVYKNLYNTAAGNLILICAGTIPGYWFTVATIDTLGRKYIQLGGFIILTVLFCILGFAYHKISDHAKLAIYILCQFFQNWGPNTITFIYPGEIFPTRYRSTAHGISAASGKVGAIIAQCVLGTLVDHNCPKSKPRCWLDHVMQIFALFMLCGIFTTLLLPETKRKTLEELSEKYHGEQNMSQRPDKKAAESESV